jgi:phosphoribosylformylglycinamidine synthase
MGAAGLTCSSFEMASHSGTGIEMDLDRVPLREEGMTPYEMLLSESQERMLLVVERGREAEVEAVFRKWELDFSVIGEVADDGRMRVRSRGRLVVDIPVDPIARNSPVCVRPAEPPKDLEDRRHLDLSSIPTEKDPGEALLALLASPNLCSREWVYRQYDQIVQASTVLRPGGDAALVRVPGTRRGLAVSTDCNPRYCWLDPRLGVQHAVAEAARNVAVTGARPLAITNCLNFGNPEKPEIMWEFTQTIRGMGEACRALGTPVVSGNVSFYNETAGEGSIPPTPTIGMLGLLEDVSWVIPAAFREPGHVVILLGETRNELGGSEYLAVRHGIERGVPPALDLSAEWRLCDFLVAAAGRRLVQSAHDLSEGGLAVALAKCAIRSGLGLDVSLPQDDLRVDALLFGESASRALLSCRGDDLDALLGLAAVHGVSARAVGETGGTRIRINPGVDVTLEEAHALWRRTLPEALS